MDNLELQKSELEEQLYSARLAQKHIPSREEIIEWFAKLKSVEETKTSLQRQVIRICQTRPPFTFPADMVK